MNQVWAVYLFLLLLEDSTPLTSLGLENSPHLGD